MNELKEKMKPFEKVHTLYFGDMGHIIFRLGTANNIELFDIEAYEKRKGYGKKLIKEMILYLKSENLEPYSVFGFTAKDNEVAQNFYKALGFELKEVDNLYKKGAYIFTIKYKDLKKIL